jgi:hypothetical protein
VKDLLCDAFCDELVVRAVPAGLAVRTPFTLSSGEPLGFYVIGPDATGRYRIEDDGTTMPLETQTRQDAVGALFDEYGATHDQENGELSTRPIPYDQVPHRALQFAALLLRLQDLLLLRPERVASTFREDAIKEIKSAIGDRGVIYEDRSPARGIEFPADLFIETSNRPPVAVYLAMSEQRVLEAVVAQMAVTYEARIDCSIIALLEKDSSISRRMRQRAVNRLAAMPIYEGDEVAAIHRIEREALGRRALLH